MTIEIATKEELQKLEAKIDKIINLLVDKNATSHRKWLKSAEVKQILSCSDTTLKNYRENGVLPSTKLGGTYFYENEEIIKTLEKKALENKADN